MHSLLLISLQKLRIQIFNKTVSISFPTNLAPEFAIGILVSTLPESSPPAAASILQGWEKLLLLLLVPLPVIILGQACELVSDSGCFYPATGSHWFSGTLAFSLASCTTVQLTGWLTISILVIEYLWFPNIYWIPTNYLCL